MNYTIIYMHYFFPETRHYLKWNIEPHIILPKDFCPVKGKLFPGDEINNAGKAEKSPYREKRNIPGVLVLTGKTYGTTGKGKSARKYYKCVPYDIRLPCILIPYDDNRKTFSKHTVNIFVLFTIKCWENKHPEGVLSNVIGRVDISENFYEYELYCKNLFISMRSFNKAAKNKTNNLNMGEHISLLLKGGKCSNRKDRHIFSIDPEGTVDIDDAMGITTTKDVLGEEVVIISIYIANVPQILSILNLWSEMTGRVSTIYLPNKKVSMLPTLLSEGIMSLKEKETRIAFAMDIHITKGRVIDVTYSNVIIDVAKNYVYDEKKLLVNKDYNDILSTTRKIIDYSKTNSIVSYVEMIEDSHDIVAYYMMMMNHMCGKELKKVEAGIYRSVTCDHPEATREGTLEGTALPKDLKNFVNIWKNTHSEYTTYGKQKGHELIGGGLDVYAQITSPIRRLVDVINMSYIQMNMGLLDRTPDMAAVLETEGRMDSLNISMRNIRKVQTNCALLGYCGDATTDKMVEGYVVGYLEQDKEYTIYIPLLKLITRIISDGKYEMHNKYRYSIHVFNEENSLHKKIRLQFC